MLRDDLILKLLMIFYLIVKEISRKVKSYACFVDDKTFTNVPRIEAIKITLDLRSKQ